MDNDLDKFLAVLELQVEIVKNTNVLNPPNSTWTREETNRCLNTLCETFRECASDIGFTLPEVYYSMVSSDLSTCLKDKYTVLMTEKMINDWISTCQRLINRSYNWKIRHAINGPLDEVDTCRKLFIKFIRVHKFIFNNVYVDFAESVMANNNSRLIKQWHVMKAKIQKLYCSTQETFVNLDSLKHTFYGLYDLDVKRIKESINYVFGDLSTIQSMCVESFDNRYMTKLLSSCLNQIVVSSVRFFTDDGTVRFWDQPKSVLVDKLGECLTLKQHVLTCYSETMNKLHIEHHHTLQFSYPTAFGNFILFFDRIDSIRNVILKYRNFGEVFETSTISRVRVLFEEFQTFFSEFTNSRGSLFELVDDPNFDADNEKFEKNFGQWEITVKEHLVAVVKEQPDFKNLISVLNKCMELNLKNLNMDYMYPKIFKKIIDHYKKVYVKHRNNTSAVLCCKMPVISGHIASLSMFIEKIEWPIKLFSKYYKPEKDLKIISRYNALYLALKAQRHLMNSIWSNDIAAPLIASNNVPLLGRDPLTRHYYSNFSRFIIETYDVAQMMIFNDLPVPDILQLRMQHKHTMYERYRFAEEIIKKYNILRDKVPNIYQHLINFEMMKMDKAILPLLNTVAWWSTDAMSIMLDIDTKITLSDRFLISVIDANKSIMDNIKNVKRLSFIDIPDAAVYPKEFEELNETNLRTKLDELVKISRHMEKSFHTIMRMIVFRINDVYFFKDEANMFNYFNTNKALEHVNAQHTGPSTEKKEIPPAVNPTSEIVDQLVMSIYQYYNFEYMESLIETFSSSLNKFSSSCNNQQFQKCADCKPVIRTKLILKDSLIDINPSCNDIKYSLRKVNKNAGKMMETLTRWGFYYMNTTEYTYKKDIVDNIVANSAIHNVENTIKTLIHEIMNAIQTPSTISDRFQDLWILDERKNEIIEFVDNAKEMHEIRSYFEMLQSKYEQIEEESSSITFGAIEFELDEFKIALSNHVNQSKILVGDRLMESSKLKYLYKYVTEKYNSLALPITELNDARRVLLCMKDVESNFVDLDHDIEYTNQLYDLLFAYNIKISQRDETRLAILNETYRLLKTKMCDVPQMLLDIYSQLRDELLEGIKSFKTAALNFETELNEKGPMVKGLKPAEAAERVLLYQDRFDQLVALMDRYQDGERLFGIPVTEYPLINENKRVFTLLKRLYDLYGKVNNSIETWSNTLWTRLRVDDIIDELSEFTKRYQKLPKSLKDWPTYVELKKKVDDWSEKMLLVEKMFKNSLKESHWGMLEKLTDTPFRVNEHDFALKHIMAAPLLENKEEIEDICQTAIKEIDIEAKLRQLISDWSVINVELTTYKNRGLLLVKGQELSDVVAVLEDSQMIIGSLAANRYNTTFKSEITEWVNKFAKTSQVLENWITVQNLWMYLEAVFIGGDIAKQLPLETKRFTNIDKLWVQIMTKARFTENVIEICTGDDSMAIYLQYMIEQLELCQKSLSGYLDQKRYIFSRFYFVSDPVLLEILGQSSNSHSIQPYLLSLFENIAKLAYSPTEYDTALRMVSREGETIALERPVICGGGVENWLNVLLNESKNSVNQIIANVANYIINDPAFDFLSMIDQYPSQMGLVGLQLLWTYHSEAAIKNVKVKDNILKKTNKLFQIFLDLLIDCTTKNLTKMERLKYETLITIHVHQKDIFESLYRMKITSILDFEWLKQERFYFFESPDRCEVWITDVLFLYQNEYLGCSDRLVITPLTDRCYITLAQAVGMNMGGAPAGPAGTGKTETTKDMGKSLGKYVVVFNCSDQMDYRGLGRIFKGLVHSGTWGCFDEFNRIELPVLSVAAQQIYTVFTARKNVHQKEFVFSDGDTVPMNPEFAIFLTMNPGYAGRQELPENLKVLFRSVAMMVPDRLIIIRVKLAACGFKNNIQLSRKFFMLYQLCEEQLSKQVHYDFGLRNILAVLRTLGTQRRNNLNDTEETILMRVLKGMNVSKLVDQDEVIFLSLIKDLFFEMKSTTTVYKELQTAITNTCDSSTVFVNHPLWNLKIVEIYETSLVRHGLMILGPTGSGKTAAIHCLLASLTATGLPHFEYRMNPKAIEASQMFGRLDVATNDWTDGIFSTLWRRTLKLNPNEYCWIVLDGPVDAVWIENLNSVLDDNKTLTLANGDRIVMAPNAKLCFEVDNVLNASPATISRMGMTFFSSTVLPWSVVFQGWGKSKSSYLFNAFKRLFNNSYEKLLKMLQSKLTPKMSLLEAHYIHQTCDILDGLLSMFPPSPDLPEIVLSRLYTFAIMWSIAAVLESANRILLEDFIKTQLKEFMNVPGRLKTGESIYEYTISVTGEWQHWGTLVDEYVYPADYIPVYGDILVPNLDNVRTMYLITLIAAQEKNVLLIGEQGTAKTVMIKSYMQDFNPETRLSKMLNFSSATTPNMFQNTVEGYMEKRFGTTYGPPGNRKMTIFIDDINMPIINTWGDQVTNEITRQLLENKGFYSLTKPGDYVNIVGVNMLGAMIHPGGGRNDIPPRLKRQFCVFNCTLPSDVSMDKIFSALGCGYFCVERFDEPVVRLTSALVPLTRLVWQKAKQKLLPTPANFHYVFNLRDLSRIWEGMLQIAPGQCPGISTLLILWCHEMQRVIYDKLTSVFDKNWFLGTILQKAGEYLTSEQLREFPTDINRLVFVDFMHDMAELEGDEPEDYVPEVPKIYEYVESLDVVKARLLMYMHQMNEAKRGSAVDLVFFQDCMTHLIIISRILRIPRGNGLLVGIGGSGRRSVTTLASFIAGYLQHSIFLTRTYSVNNFLDDLRLLYRHAGYDDSKTTFVFTDNDIKDEAFLEYINNILSSGEVANLFPKDELDEMLNNLTSNFRKKNPKGVPTWDNLYEFFINQAKNNLHLVLCFSPIGESFRLRSLKFPGIISGCIIDWYTAWPEDALLAVSHHLLHDFPMVCTVKAKESLIKLLGDIHDDMTKDCISYYQRYRRQIFVTPKSFLSFVNGYKILYKKNLLEIEEMKAQRILGLEKLADASVQVEVLKEELIEKEKEIVIATNASNEVTASMNEVVKDAEISKAEVVVVKERAQLLLKAIAKDKSKAEIKLAKAQPALDAAEAALLTINATDISTVRKLGKPPYLITLIMDCVLILFKRPLLKVIRDPAKSFLTPNWSMSLKMMSDTRFLYSIQNFPKEQIFGETIDLLQPYFKYPDYTFQKAKLACGNVAGLLSWTLAMSDFYNVYREVLPLKTNLAKQEAIHSHAKAELKAVEAVANEKNRQLMEASRTLNAALNSQRVIQNEADRCKNKMDSATALIEGLKGERKRWTDQLAGYNLEIEHLLGDIVKLVGFLSYSGPFNQEYRTKIMNSWSEKLDMMAIPNSLRLVVTEKLTDPPTISEWNLQGLPNDELSTQNGIIVTKSSKYPILIDPQSQGITWIKNKESANGLVAITFDDKYFINRLEDCISLGRPLLIHDVLQEVDPMMTNILEKNFYKTGRHLKVALGDKEVDVSDDFRLYLTSKLGNPSYPPEIYAKCAIIDFTVTIKGLEDQLLSRVIETEKRELEHERVALILEVTSQKRKMQKLEHDLLVKLTTIQGSLVDDESVLYTLNKTKDTAADVREKLEVAGKTHASINEMREKYRPIATRGSVLYFLVVEMGKVNPMYQNSLQQFLERFDLSLDNAEPSLLIERRIENIIAYLTYAIFKYKCRGLYERHKTIFTVLVALKIDLDRGSLTHSHFEFFVKGGASIDLHSIRPKPAEWINDTCWMNLGMLQTIYPFGDILVTVENNEKMWRKWYEKNKPEEETIPDEFDQIGVFDKLLLIRAWCPDRTLNQAFKYVKESLGSKYTRTVMFDIEEMYAESRSTTPMICFLSNGSDPSSLVENTAKRKDIPFYSISMGQGQEVYAEKLLKNCLVNGGWVLLQNCHLCLDFMQETYQYIITEVAESTRDNDFRIWITTEEHPKFSISLLQISIHFTYEPPEGLRAGLMRTFNSMGDDMLNFSNLPQYKPILYVISFMHSVVQERRKFGPVGWNIPYEFNTADWYSSVLYLQKMVEDVNTKSEINWIALRYMLGEVHYGGRVTDDYDRRLLTTMMKYWFADQIFDAHFHFHPGYNMLNFNTLPEYFQAIESMPLKDPPDVCGLHTNADITYQTNIFQKMCDTITSIQPKSSGGGSEVTREKKVYEMAEDMLKKLPPVFNMFDIKERLKDDVTKPMTIFLGQEIDRIQVVLELVKNTLEDLLLAIDGIIIMNETLSDTLDFLYDGRVPAHWLKISWTSSTIGFWFVELSLRFEQIASWTFKRKPTVFWMTGFFNPQGFLTAMKQEVSRAHRGWTLDNIQLENEVTNYTETDVRKPPLEGVYVHGLYLEGASWNNKGRELIESVHKVMFTKMPVIHVFAINSLETKKTVGYMCPVYKKPHRTGLTYVCELCLKTSRNTNETHWIMRGVALLCDIK